MAGPWAEAARLDDVQELRIRAKPEAVWNALASVLPESFDTAAARRFASGLHAVPRASAGPFPADGSSLPGFEVAASVPPTDLVLAGRHRFAAYTLAFRLEPDGEATRLVATSRAEFRGIAGRAYRLVAVGIFHKPLLRNLLRTVRRRARRESRRRA